MAPKKPRNLKKVRFQEGQKARRIITTTAEGRFIERFGAKFGEMVNANLRTIARLSRKRAQVALTQNERNELAKAYKNMRLLTRKHKQRFTERAKQASRKATRDPKFKAFLTDAFFKEQLGIKAKRHRKSALGFLDIDHLKDINDSYSHAAGDIVIRAMSEALGEVIGKKGGIVGRHGGEEILVWAPVSPSELASILRQAAQKMQEKITRGMQKAKIEFPHAASFSAGIVEIDGKKIAQDFQGEYKTALKQADDLLYHSKRGGRNAYTLVTSKGQVTKKIIKK